MNWQSIARQPLGFFPTPMHSLPSLSAHLAGPQIYIKRDDLSGLALGGNKVRKLEFLLGEALQQKADCIISAGAAQSNHCRQTAAAAAKLNLPCYLLLGGKAPEHAQGNVLLDKLFGATVIWTGEQRKGEGIAALEAKLKNKGLRPYVVPYGGSDAIGCLGFAAALEELLQQQSDIEEIVFASSSGATHAGLMLAKAYLDSSIQLRGINIDKANHRTQHFSQTIADLANTASEQFGLDSQFSARDVCLDDEYLGEGYAVLGDAEREAIMLLAETEGILLDPVYTAKAMAGLIARVRQGKYSSQQKILFWHTGGTPALFAYAKQLLS
ncbi:D-cysteine desulfhydrase family protein [Agarivorans sp. 1_MG-2023]|uniref:D-cysteine desulfhydrase family protein n=1 Tax=Agarivorans sp. 1_MG-2023 TaxID=3062634 RepID=UPI0026E29288|nr:D-cysteine desulfhydrase family protein [Agarivorans sp. 1_MG-2023]MDO6763174.1 D-cysteine desulfhydrase family protein [Agarivorans sp. 1_MG-2023]